MRQVHVRSFRWWTTSSLRAWFQLVLDFGYAHCCLLPQSFLSCISLPIRWWRPSASVLPPSYLSSIQSSAQFSNMLRRSWPACASDCPHAEASRRAHPSPSAVLFSVPVHGLCPRPICAIPVSVPPLGSSGGCTWIGRRWRYNDHHLLSCRASPHAYPALNNLWADLWRRLLNGAPARQCERLTIHVNFFHADSVRGQCMPWHLHDISFLQGCPCSRRDTVFSVIAALALLVGASVVRGSSYGFACLRF
jgi:hypothetical protein